MRNERSCPAGQVVPRFAERARMVLARASGAPNAQVAVEIGVSVATVRKWRGKFAAEGMAGLEDAVRIGRPKVDLVLSEGERGQLVRWARRAKTAQFLALRAKIVLRCAEGGTNKQAPDDLGVDTSTVDRWRRRFRTRSGGCGLPLSLLSTHERV